MKKFESFSRCRTWSMALLLSAVALVATGCGGGRDEILGANGATVIVVPVVPFVPPVGGIFPGTCTAAGPKVSASDPANGNQSASTSTTGVANNGKSVTATFDQPMNGATINANSFTLAPAGGAALVPASVSYDVVTRVATLTTAAALVPATSYTAVIQGAITDASGTTIGCNYVWSFKTAAALTATPPSVNLGLADAFGIAATAGVKNTLTVPNTQINGNAVLSATPTCNAVAAPGGNGAAGFGLCGGAAPAINGTVVTPTFPDTTTADAVVRDLRAAYLSITPPAGPPAAGSLGGGTSIPAGTTLGASAGSAPVIGDNLFFPGVYTSNTSILITGDLTLDAQGDPNARFVFQSASTVGAVAGTAAPGPHTRILLINGAKASNVWWQAGSAATLGTSAEWQGNILAAGDVTMETGASSCGRLFAGAFTSGAFVFDSNLVSVPGHVNAPPTCQ
jgi:Ice-binding-like/Bacterial Ig-like domain